MPPAPAPSPRPRRLLAALLLVTAAALARGPARADDEPPSLPRALFLEKTSRDPKAALAVFSAVAADPATPSAARGEARLGEVRCLLALGREDDAMAALKRLEQDPEAPLSAKEEARARLEERARAKAAAAAEQEEARSTEAIRRAEQVRIEQEARIAAAARLVDAAEAHVKARRYEEARACLIEALAKNPADDRAVTLLEEVGGHADRGELLRQAIRFVASNRVVDYGRLSSVVGALRKGGMKELRDGKPATAARAFRDAIARIDESDFYADLAEVRRELVMLLERALKTCEERGIALDEGLSVPAERTPEAAAAAKAWRSEFFSLLGRIFASRSEDGAPVRFYDAAIPPDPTPDAKGNRFTSKGIPATVGPGPLRRARWLERQVRDEIAPGSFAGADRLLDRYEDLLIVQHTGGVLRAVDALVARFAASPAPVLVDVRVLGAAPGGLADVARLLDAIAAPGESTSAIVTRGRRMSEADLLLSSSDKLVLLSQATVRLVGRHGALAPRGRADAEVRALRRGRGAPGRDPRPRRHLRPRPRRLRRGPARQGARGRPLGGGDGAAPRPGAPRAARDEVGAPPHLPHADARGRPARAPRGGAGPPRARQPVPGHGRRGRPARRHPTPTWWCSWASVPTWRGRPSPTSRPPRPHDSPTP